MANTWLLTKVMIKNSFGFSFSSKKGRRAILLYALGMILIGAYGVMLGFTCYMLFMLGLAEQTVSLALLVENALLIFMAIFVIPSVFYFSKDLTIYLAMPLSPTQIIAAKTLLLSVYLSPIIAAGTLIVTISAAFSGLFSALQIVLIFIGSLVSMSITMLLLCSIMMLLMRLMPFFRNKDRFMVIIGSLSILLAVGSVYLSNSIPNAGIDEGSLKSMDVSGMMWFFPGCLAALKSVFPPNFLWFLAELLFLAASLGLFCWISSRMYLSSAMDAISSSPKKVKAKKGALLKDSLDGTLFKIDLHRLIRTPAYLTNNVLSSLVMPLIVLVSAGSGLSRAGGDANSLIASLDGFMNEQGISRFWVSILIGLMIGYLFSCMNGICATAISREGRDGVAWMKSIPLSYQRQMMAKLKNGMLFSVASGLIVIVLGAVFLPWRLVFVIGSLTGLVASSLLDNLFSLLIDIIHPKLDWQEEAAAAKNNFNVFLDMIIPVILIVVVSILLFAGVPVNILSMVLLALTVLGDIVCWKLPGKFFAKYL